MNQSCPQGHAAATRAIRTQADIIVAMAPAVQELDADGIHDMRVASRRLRMALQVYRSYVPGKARKVARGQTKRIIALLGIRRELDVMVEMLREHREETRALWQRFMDHAIALLEKRRDDQATACREAVALAESDDFAQTIGTLLDGVDATGTCLHELAREELLSAHDSARVARKYWKKTGGPDDLHRVRIELKHLRYACEFHRDCFGEAMADYIKEVKAAQSVLGEWNECRLLEDMVITLGNAADYEIAQGAPLVAEAYGTRAADLAGQFHGQGKSLLGKAARHAFLEIVTAPALPCCHHPDDPKT